MPIVIVEIDLGNCTATPEEIRAEWHAMGPHGEKKEGWIGLDDAYLTRDYEDDSFFIFKLVDVIE